MADINKLKKKYKITLIHTDIDEDTGKKTKYYVAINKNRKRKIDDRLMNEIINMKPFDNKVNKKDNRT
jgi:hypothetical protein